MGLDLRPFPVVDLVCDFDERVVGSDVGYLIVCLGDVVDCLNYLGGLPEELVVVQCNLKNF